MRTGRMWILKLDAVGELVLSSTEITREGADGMDPRAQPCGPEEAGAADAQEALSFPYPRAQRVQGAPEHSYWTNTKSILFMVSK